MNLLLLNDINNIKEYLSTLKTKVFGKDQVLHWFQDLCNLICDFLLKIAENIRNAKEPLDAAEKDTLLLYLLQLHTALSVLINIFSTESQIGISIDASRDCISHQISICLSGLETVINAKIISNDNNVGFVKFIDLALDKIGEIEVENENHAHVQHATEEATKIVEEVLCHAMSIAQVALSCDCNAIKGSSKEVLSNLDFLNKQLSNSSPNVAMCNLYLDSTCDKLCALERKVNSAVMRLALKGFAQCAQPLDDLHKYCLGSQKDEETLDELIADFDLHADRIIQVGLFAIASSSDRNCTLKMRSCLASMEALEGELVPALTTLIKDGNVHNLCHADILKTYWIQQAHDLKHLIYRILDPLAFCQVTFDVVRDANEALEERLRDVAYVMKKEHVKTITLQSNVLYEMLLIDSGRNPHEDNDLITKYLNDVHCVTMEIDAAGDELLTEDEISKCNVFRVFKRCKVLENVLRKLLKALENAESKQNLNNSQMNHTNTGKLILEEDYNTKRQNLEEITLRGKQILKDRSILYKSPKKTSTTSIIHVKRSKPMPLCRLVHLRNMQFAHSRSIVEPSCNDLQITSILANLSTLSMSMKL